MSAIATTAPREQEEIIERGLRSFFQVGNALAKIRYDGLCKSEYATFEH